MRYDDPVLRQQLAGAYALGSLRGGARARFERLMEHDRELRRLVVAHQEDFTPLVLSAREIQPPPRIRKALTKATLPRVSVAKKSRWWERLAVWHGVAAANAVLAVALIAIVTTEVVRQDDALSPELVYVGVLSDANAQPGVAVLAYKNPSRLEIAAKVALTAPPQSELHLWIRDRTTDTPVFLAAIPVGGTSFPLGEQPWQLLRRAKALVITQGLAGVPATLPGEELLYEGVCVNLKKWSSANTGG